MLAQEAKATLDNTPKKDQPAFPTRVDLDPMNQCYLFGITRLEYFAAAALTGYIAKYGLPEDTATTAIIVFGQAEAMCRESEKRKETK